MGNEMNIEPPEDDEIQRPHGWQYLVGVLFILALTALAWWIRTH